MIYKADLVKSYGISPAQAGEILAGIDFDGLREQNRRRYRFELWDGESAVNGVPAETIQGRADYPRSPEAAAYFVYREGKPVYFQYTNPRGGGYMDAQGAAEEAAAQIDRLAERDAYTEATELVKQSLETVL